MAIDSLLKWHALVASRSAQALEALLANDVIFHSPIVHTPQIGKAITTRYLLAALHDFGNETFRYVRELSGTHDAVLEFMLELDGIAINGVDMLRWNDEGRIVEFKVMLRPLQAVNLIHTKMGQMLRAGKP